LLPGGSRCPRDGEYTASSVAKLPLRTLESVPAAYVEERQRLVVTRVKLACVLGFSMVGISAVVNSVAFLHERLWEHLATHFVQLGLCLLVWGLSRCRWAERFAIALAVCLAAGLGTTLFWSIGLSAADLDVLVGPLTIVMVFPTLLFPWGVGPQILVSLYLAAGYLALLPWEGLEATRLTNVMISLTLGVAASVIGAWVIDRQRRATFSERERVEALAREREMLVEAGRELNSAVELPELVDRITSLSRRLIGSDAASLTLLDPQQKALRVVAISGDWSEQDDDILGVEFSFADGDPFLAELVGQRSLQIPGGTSFDALQVSLLERFGIARTLYVALVRDGALLGFLNFGQRSLDPAFGDRHVRLAEGLAHQAAVALVNARLVDDLQRANRIKTEFVSTMSHELRTPLHVIMGYTDMIEEATLEERGRMIEKLRGSGRELLELIDATLNLNRLEHGRDEPTLAPLAVRELCDELRAEFGALPHRSGVALRWHPVDDLVLLTDRRKLKIVLKNLVGNALKFTARGTVDVQCSADAECCTFTVSDTGCGIDPEHLPVVFEMFRQIDSSDKRSYGGVGLGLYIVHRLVGQLGGTIAAESTLGRGSTFSVTLPGVETAGTLLVATA
jgi:signal transduction histidine kinase